MGFVEGSLRILFTVFNQTGRGTYWRALNLARALDARGHSVTLLCTAPRARWSFSSRQEAGVTVVEAPDLLSGPLRSGWDPYASWRRRRWVRRRSFDLVHAFETRPVALYPALAARKRGATMVTDWCDWFGRGGSVEQRPQALVRAVLRPVETYFEEHWRPQAAGNTVINSVLRDKALALGIPAGQLLLLPNGAELEAIRPGDRPAARRRLGLDPGLSLIAYTGAIFAGDARLMATAFDRIHAALPSSRLLLIGYCKAPIDEMVDAPDAVIRTGPVSQGALADYLVASDVGWLPLCDSGANRGRFPMKLADFMAAGLPVVATDVGDVGTLLREAGFGLAVAPDAISLAGGVLTTLGDAASRNEWGRRARREAEQRFNWMNIGAEVEIFYRQCIARTSEPVQAGVTRRAR